jgi:hypothetical protein
VNEGVNIHPREQISPLGARGQVKNGPLVFNRAISKGVNDSFTCYERTELRRQRAHGEDDVQVFLHSLVEQVEQGRPAAVRLLRLVLKMCFVLFTGTTATCPATTCPATTCPRDNL